MTEPMFKLATAPRPEPHKFGAAMVRSRLHEQHERCCVNCTLVKITVIPQQGEPWREYRWGDGPQFCADVDPPCRANPETVRSVP